MDQSSPPPAPAESSTRTFDLLDVLQVTTHFIVSPRRVAALYDVLSWMTGESVFTHQLPRAGRECAAAILERYPELREAAVPSEEDRAVWERTGNPAGWVPLWQDDMLKRFGPTRELTRLPAREPQYDTPIGDLVEMVGPERVIVVDPK